MSKFKIGPDREKVDLSELQKSQAQGTIITDDRRRRPLWFDGRFLDARALNEEQDYFLARQSDYGRVAGFGVVSGLGVRVQPGKARTLVIDAGHGVTPAGGQVVLPEPVVVDLADVAEGRRLDAGFGISAMPRPSPFNRTGLYVLALRAVEYTGMPIATYPTHVDAERSVHDGSVIEATAVTLIAFPDAGAGTELDQRRSLVVREIFYDETLKGQPEDVLPLAMLALDHGIVKWLDLFMVRREIAQRERNVWGLGISPRPLRAAHLRQYSAQLNELRTSLGSEAQIVASEYFRVLPPAGPMPVSGVNASDFTHNYFPAEMDLELSIVPDDELPALIEDSMLLPPIDLEMSGEALESTSILVLIPVPRHLFRSLSQDLPSLIRELPAAQPGMLAKRKPVTVLHQLLLHRSRSLPEPRERTVDSRWRTELVNTSQLWYLRRRNLHYKAEVASWYVDMSYSEVNTESLVSARIEELNLKSEYANLLSRSTHAGAAEMTRLFGAPLMTRGSEAYAKAAVAELAKVEKLDSREVRKVAERYSEPSFGEGLARIETVNEDLRGNTDVEDNIAKSGALPELDRLGRILSEEELRQLGEKLAEAGSGRDPTSVDKVAELIKKTSETKASGVYAELAVSKPAALSRKRVPMEGPATDRKRVDSSLLADAGRQTDVKPPAGAGKQAKAKPSTGSGRQADARPSVGTGKQVEAKPVVETSEKEEAKPAAGTSKKAEAKPAAGTSKKAEAKPAAATSKKAEAKPTAPKQNPKKR